MNGLEVNVSLDFIEESNFDSDGWYDDSNISCADCPDGECTGHCMSCSYRPV